ncbi:MAG: hypothetical protein ACP5IT_11950, partial [Thermoproteota archaeon]
MVTYSGIGGYSNGDILSFSASFTAFIGGERRPKEYKKQRIYFLGMSDKPQVIGSLFSHAVNYVGEQLGSVLTPKEFEQLSSSKVTSSVLVFNRRAIPLCNLGTTQYIIKNDSIKKLETETALLDGSWVVISSNELSKKDVNLVQRKIKEGITPKYLAEYVSRTNSALKALAVVAINAKLANYDFLRGNPS